MIADEIRAITGHCGRLLLELAILQLSADPKKEISWGCVGAFSQDEAPRMEIIYIYFSSP